jgi:hypothetical protein
MSVLDREADESVVFSGEMPSEILQTLELFSTLSVPQGFSITCTSKVPLSAISTV